jgi:disease resistance protein RPS2
VFASLALGNALIVLFFGGAPALANADKHVKRSYDAVEALLQLRADVHKEQEGAPEPEQPRACLRCAQDEVAPIKAQHDAGQLYVIRLLQYVLSTGPIAELLEATMATPQASLLVHGLEMPAALLPLARELD